jgi:two-component system phosphate regulon response regulator OmpR
MTAKIIVLDDDPELRTMLKNYLSDQGFTVRTVASAPLLMSYLTREHFDVLILDLMMEPEDGLSICRRLRAAEQTIPILMLTARGDPIDRVVGLEMGADDYLPKPFLPQELVARLKAILRRTDPTRQEHTEAFSRVTFGPYCLNVDRHTLYRDDESVVHLNTAEIALLMALASTPNRAVSRENLMARARGKGYEALDRSVDVQILRLRQHLETDPSNPLWIKTVWGTGYMLITDSNT